MSPVFKYHAKDKKGLNKIDAIKATSQGDAIHKLEKQGLSVVSIELVTDKDKTADIARRKELKLSPDEKEKIYREEMARAEFREKIKEELKGRKIQYGILASFIVVIVVIVMSISWRLFSVEKTKREASKLSASRSEDGFRGAFEGEYWVIEDEKITVSKKPKISANEEQFFKNFTTSIRPGTKVKVIKSNGISDSWKQVRIYNDRNRVSAEGWIFSKSVRRAKRVQEKGFLSWLRSKLR